MNKRTSVLVFENIFAKSKIIKLRHNKDLQVDKIPDVNYEEYLSKLREFDEPEPVIRETEPYYKSCLAHSNDFVNKELQHEPILSEENYRYSIHPIQYHDIWANYLAQKKQYWVVGEVDLTADKKNWRGLDDRAKIFITHVLGFFAISDGLVNMNIKKNLVDMVKIKEAECAYNRQAMMEDEHGLMYSLLLDELIPNIDLKKRLFSSIKTLPVIKRKTEWCEKWINSDKPYHHKLIAFIIVEGVFFSGSFAAIFWMDETKFPGLYKSNRFIARDENLHTELGYVLYSHLKNRLKQDVIYEIMEEAVEIEIEYIKSALSERLDGMNMESMVQYIKYVADRVLVRLGCDKKYNATNPFEFMEKIDAFLKANFFEERADSYSDSKVDNPRVFKIGENY